MDQRNVAGRPPYAAVQIYFIPPGRGNSHRLLQADRLADGLPAPQIINPAIAPVMAEARAPPIMAFMASWEMTALRSGAMAPIPPI